MATTHVDVDQVVLYNSCYYIGLHDVDVGTDGRTRQQCPILGRELNAASDQSPPLRHVHVVSCHQSCQLIDHVIHDHPTTTNEFFATCSKWKMQIKHADAPRHIWRLRTACCALFMSSSDRKTHVCTHMHLSSQLHSSNTCALRTLVRNVNPTPVLPPSFISDTVRLTLT